MTCSEQFSLSRARYRVLPVLYIVLFPLLSFRTVQHVLQMASIDKNQEQLTLNGAWIKGLNYTQRKTVDGTCVYIQLTVLPRSAAEQLDEAVTNSLSNRTK